MSGSWLPSIRAQRRAPSLSGYHVTSPGQGTPASAVQMQRISSQDCVSQIWPWYYCRSAAMTVTMWYECDTVMTCDMWHDPGGSGDAGDQEHQRAERGAGPGPRLLLWHEHAQGTQSRPPAASSSIHHVYPILLYSLWTLTKTVRKVKSIVFFWKLARWH